MDEPRRQLAKLPKATLGSKPDRNPLFGLGLIVMTPGVAALGVDFGPYLARHVAGDWGDLDAFDVRQNVQAVQDGLRILSAYSVPAAYGRAARIWIITEADRSATTVLLPQEY
ncbi:MAG: type I restriction endonuclease subunit M [Candidatus Promineifilaceae bacterium]